MPLPNPHKLPVWWCGLSLHTAGMQQAAGSFCCLYAWTSSMRPPKHEVADVCGVGWGWGDSARMDGPRASSYRMPRCGRVSDVITGSPSKCAPTLAEQSCLSEGRETPTAFAHVSHQGNSRRRWNAKAEYPDVISHPESSPGQLLTHLGLSFVHS